MGKGDGLGTFRDGGVHHTLVLVVIGGDYLAEGFKAAAVRHGDALEVHGVVKRCLEFLRLEIQGVHHLLGFPHCKFRGGCLKHVLGIFRAEAENLLSVHNCLAKAIGNLGNAFLRPFVADRVEVYASGYT